ncbi:hypothetical protein IEO21_10527 [Rhodonia placenta]|uniref:Uncharacterized protein n=1 Tax=Rhodonia placenta TaxID=104341 RepID=A0A8H7NSG4_9APHY|nr:hypothetical protein IEO21_10527 [Postia placenta]
MSRLEVKRQGNICRRGAFDWFSPKRWDKRSKLRSLGQQRQAYIQGKFREGCAHWSVHSWSMCSMLTWPRGPVSQSGCVSRARAVPRTAVPSNLIIQ